MKSKFRRVMGLSTIVALAALLTCLGCFTGCAGGPSETQYYDDGYLPDASQYADSNSEIVDTAPESDGESYEPESSAPSFNGYEGRTFEQIVSGDIPSSYLEQQLRLNALFAELQVGMLFPITSPKLVNNASFAVSEDELTEGFFYLKRQDGERGFDIARIPVTQGAKCWTDDADFIPWAVSVTETQYWTIGDDPSAPTASDYGIRDASWDDIYYYNFSRYEEIGGVSLEGLEGEEREAAGTQALEALGIRYEDGIWISNTEQVVVCGFYSGTQWNEVHVSFIEKLWAKEAGVAPVNLAVTRTHDGLFEVDLSPLDPGYYVIDSDSVYGLFYGDQRLICIE